MAAQYQIIKSQEKDRFYFVLKGANGEVLAVGEGYTRLQDAKRGVKAHRKAALTARTVVVST